MTVWHEKPELLVLRKKWYAKLKKDGFNDIERIHWENGDTKPQLKGVRAKLLASQYTPETEEYYRLAEQWTRRVPTKGKQRKVWKLHSEGWGRIGIAGRLGLTEYRVSEIVHKNASLMLLATKQGAFSRSVPQTDDNTLDD